jgi:Raf kinase inhibitor-like YbhB/YbcL family protein
MKFNLGALTLTGPAFGHGERIPARYTSAGDGISPPLAWANVPEGTQSLALLSHDPDAPLVTGFTHWMLWDIPADVTSLEEGDTRFTAGPNGLGQPGWFPPSPPPGHGDHFYYFHLYALDAPVGPAPADMQTFLTGIDAHILNQARLVGIHRTD